MKAAVLFGKGDLRVTEFPDPVVHDGDVLVAVSYCGICGTDLHKFAGMAGSRPVKYPVPLGHEISGTVAAVGASVTGFKVGDRVCVDPNWSCGKCEFCRRGIRHLCTSSRGVVKGMAQYVSSPEENVYHVPDSLDLRYASLAEPLSCCLHGVDLLDLRTGDTVVIIGLGAIGMMMTQIVRAATGMDPVCIDALESKREVAEKVGARLFINSRTENIKEVLAANGITNPTKVLECVGLPVTAEMALDIAGRGATVVLFGVAANGAVAGLNLYDAFTKELVIKTSYINPGTTARAIDMLASGAIDASLLISAEISLDEFPAEIVSREHIKNGKVIVRIE